MELGLNRLPWHGQIVTCLVLAMAGWLAFHLNWVAPLRAERAREELGVVELRAEVARALQTASRLPELDADVTHLDQRFEDLRAALPDGQTASGLLRRLQTMAAHTDLSIRGFTPQAVEEREGHSAWPIRLELDGTFHNLGIFFDRVGKSSQVITIDDVLMQAIEPPRLNATIRVQCTATTFVLSASTDPSDTDPVI